MSFLFRRFSAADADARPTVQHGADVAAASDQPAKRTLHRGATTNHLSQGENLRGIVSDINTGAKPNLQYLRQKHLDADTVIDQRELEQVKVLGQGAFGIVWKCEYVPRLGSDAEKLVDEAGGFVALKKLKVKVPLPPTEGMAMPAPTDTETLRISDRELSDFASELIMLKSLKNPHVIGYIGCTLHQDADGVDQIGIVQEYAPHGTLKPLVNSESHFTKLYTTADGLRWGHHIALGLAFLHACEPPIIHRDLKPENVLLCGTQCVAKIADFGLVTFEKKTQRHENFRMTGMVGSMRYMAPENYRGEDYSRKNDVYSFAIILYELLLRSRAYEGLYLSTEEIAKNAGSGTLRPEIPAPWPAEARELLIKAWHHDPNVRPEFSTIAPELGKWRNDTDCRVLKGLAKGSKRGIFERIGYEKNAIVASYGMKKRGRQGSVLGRSGSFSGIGRRSLGAGSSSGNGKRSRPHDQEKRLTQ